MKISALTLLSLLMVIGTAMAMGVGNGTSAMKVGDGSEGNKRVRGMKRRGKGHHRRCHKEPPPMFMDIFGLMCEADNCAENAPKCMAAMMPKVNMCEIRRECWHSREDSADVLMNLEEKPLDKGMMMECILKLMMEDMGLEYIPDDYKANSVAMINKTVSDSPDLSEKAKIDVISAVTDDVCACVSPGTEDYMKKKVQFLVCMMNTCVKSMAG